MASVCLVGATGLVGGHILSTLKSSAAVDKIYAFSRKELPEDPKLTSLVSKDSASWAQTFPTGQEIFFSGLATTRGQVGGFENQRKIDYDLNLELAKAARANGAKVYVLISGNGASSSSMFSYIKMKGELEDAVKAIDFEHIVLVQPGLIVGQRAASDSRPLETAFRKIATGMGAVSGGRLKDFWAQDADVIAKAAVKAGLDCINGNEKERVRVLSQADIVRLGRTDWHS